MAPGTAETDAAAKAGEADIIGSRVFDAPRELVFRLWSDPKHIVHWWGPRGFTNTIQKMDFRPGGEWNFVMHGPDGRDYQNKIVYDEIVRPERIAYSHLSGPLFHAVVDFEDLGGKTRVTLKMTFESAELRDNVATEFGAVEGMSQTLARLGEQVAQVVAEESGQAFVVSRTFNAPRELVFRAWTECEHLMKWWGPKGFTMSSCKVDLRRDGMFHYCLRSPDGHEMWGRFVYREIVRPERLVFVVSFSDANGGVTHHPMAPAWPLETLSTLTFTEADGQTLVTMRGIAVNASEEERKTFEAGFASMNQGWKGTLDQLEEHLGKA